MGPQASGSACNPEHTLLLYFFNILLYGLTAIEWPIAGSPPASNCQVMIMRVANRLFGVLTIAVLLPILASCSRQTITGTNTIAWDSTELQTEIGTKNSNKKKLVMRVWHDVSELQSDGTYHWFVRYSIKAEDHNLTNSGWHYAPDLATFTFNANVQVPGSWTSPISITLNLTGLQTHSDFVAYVSNAKPIFLSKTATATRSGGNSGISVVW